ncbi:MAG: deoxyguanosinetriphosphate triphosphohydrolase [Verrucomicrobia bacterium]|nr:deoxyguanosinetriphosphate triphosphohydrolase [Verrucomicrobiota bacterium]
MGLHRERGDVRVEAISMQNRFYNDFDIETYGGGRKSDYRSPFQIDRDRIIHAHAFRKLQSKTQVFLSGEYDFYRTRLTHSMEVAQIGRSICHYLKTRGGLLKEDFFIDGELVEGICLAHDLGHPPFGHSGERTLQELMIKWGGFEGNAQTLRLLTGTLYQNETSVRGMQPTRALLDGVLKYKKLFREFPKKPQNHFLYDPQAAERDYVFGSVKIPRALHAGENLNVFKSVECQVMDWADDAAYSLNDIVDGVKAGFLTQDKVETWAGGEPIDAQQQQLLDVLFDAIRADRLENVFAQKIGVFICACRLRERDNFMAAKTNRYRFELVVSPEAEREAKFFKKVANDIIFESPQLQQIEHKARRVLFDLWGACWNNYVEKGARVINVLPARVGKLIDGEKTTAGKARQICDYLAGLTDGMIVHTYRRLFDPEFGSIRDLS